MTTIATWGLKLTPGKPHKFDSFPDDEDLDVVLRISNASLTEKLADDSRTIVKITKHKSGLDEDGDDEDAELPLEEFVLCSLIPGKVEQVSLSIEFGPDLVQFEVIGKNEVHLLGNWIDISSNNPPFGSDDEDESDEDAYRLDDVSSDVEMHPDDLLEDGDETDGSRFEEVDEAPKAKGLKRAAEAMEEDATLADGLSKKQKKKLAKKLKNAEGDGVAVSTATTAASVTSVDTSPKKDKKEKENKGEAKESKKGEKQTLPGGLTIVDAKKGTGKAAKKGNTLGMRYIGKLENGKVFDKNTAGAPFRFRLGAGEVIKGWDQGLVGMQVGGERVLTIPAALAYGAKGSPPEIPPNSTLKFEVKLIEIK